MQVWLFEMGSGNSNYWALVANGFELANQILFVANQRDLKSLHNPHVLNFDHEFLTKTDIAWKSLVKFWFNMNFNIMSKLGPFRLILIKQCFDNHKTNHVRFLCKNYDFGHAKGKKNQRRVRIQIFKEKKWKWQFKTHIFQFNQLSLSFSRSYIFWTALQVFEEYHVP